MKTNTNTEICIYCKSPIKPNGGAMSDAGPMHLICRAQGTAGVSSIQFAPGTIQTENNNGRCEDAPCCGCCDTFTGMPPTDDVIVHRLFGQDPEQDGEALDPNTIEPREYPANEFRPILFPDGMSRSDDLTVPEIEDQLERIYQVEKKSDGEFCIAAGNEDGRIVARLLRS